ncbi:hypothetical protein DDB_G0271476 [Dictyostelium discoideum AX4]|uniref:Amine oxidase domain-containing protein n=1 Tax=Dictyostelium discoideum TaxID=44689 RepID=Q55B17_DICDI|nr:hypothetical protein DDB_G0271476 [Dictyostelium discoideum AX4]EAL71868.1 hypothetical protein DDB_G0271476 [Dictyostelium discoideum AX4]|eukprot:XP_645795.1 hypothetical protein DDB_G0271476 [Dictyostelium discoideum AX4]
MYKKILLIFALFILVNINFASSEFKKNETESANLKSLYASYLMKNNNNTKYNNNDNSNNTNIYNDSVTKNKSKNKNELTVGIIGGGIAGLYAGMLFIKSMIFDDLGIDYTILEANKERVGGRVYTHKFDDHKYSYTDLGAMRIPLTPLMDRIVSNQNYSLFSKLAKGGYQIPTVPFLISVNNEISYYNGIRVLKGSPVLNPSDPFNYSDSNNGGPGKGIPDEYANRTVDSLILPVFYQFINNLTVDFYNGFKQMLKYDSYSARDYLKTFHNYPNSVIEYIENLSTISGRLDQTSITELLMSVFDFSGEKFVCVEGGTGLIVKSMSQIIKKKVEMGSFVTKISKSFDKKNNEIDGLNVEVVRDSNFGGSDTEILKFKHVISTTTLPALQRIDTSDLKLPLKLKVAIRSLKYTGAIKLAINFKYRWWEDSEFMSGKPIRGGSSNTDLLLRQVVYPSYGINNGTKGVSGVLLASYSGGLESIRISSMIGKKDKERKLLNIVLRDLAEIHNVDLKKLKNLYKDHFFQSWDNDEFSSGAFALFSTSQYTELFPSTGQSHVDGRFHLSGELTSVHHAWMIGGLNSAYRSVDLILKNEGFEDLRIKLRNNWGTIEQAEYPSLDWYKYDSDINHYKLY